MNTILRRWVKLPPVKWQAAFERLDWDTKAALSDTAASMATCCARLSAYASRRMSGGRHEDAVKAQNAAARKVRQALGYTYADDKLTF